jgi:type II secretory pathway predicted ATPase ExeA
MNVIENFEMSQEPFSNAPVSRFYYNSVQHSEALTRLTYAADSMKGLAVLVGQIGAGKTTLARRMLDSLPEDKYEAALLVIIHSGITASWLLRRIAIQLGVHNPAGEKLTLLGQLYKRLVEIYEQGKKAVLLIDEAQMLETRELMEEFRGLTNLEVPERKLVSFVFFGLPEIERNLMLDPPLAQRVAVRVKLEPFDRAATEAYIKHRLRLAGAQRMLFNREALDVIHAASGGIPRVVNTLCDNGLFEAFLKKRPFVDGRIAKVVAQNMKLTTGAALGIVPNPAATATASVQAAVATPAAAPPAVDAPPRARKKPDLASIDAMLAGLQK